VKRLCKPAPPHHQNSNGIAAKRKGSPPGKGSYSASRQNQSRAAGVAETKNYTDCFETGFRNIFDSALCSANVVIESGYGKATVPV
jgi:hypothetical protein